MVGQGSGASAHPPLSSVKDRYRWGPRRGEQHRNGPADRRVEWSLSGECWHPSGGRGSRVPPHAMANGLGGRPRGLVQVMKGCQEPDSP